MKGKIILAVGVAGLMVSVAAIPTLVLGSLPTVEYVRPKQRVVEQELSCVGVVYAQNEVEVYLDTPVIATQVPVAVGDRVEAGALLAQVDVEQTLKVLSDGIHLEASALAGLGDLEQSAKALAMGNLNPQDLQYFLEQYQSTYGLLEEKSTLQLQPEIFAPISGVITQKNLRPSFLTKLSQPAFVISDLDSCMIVAALPQSQMDRIALGDPVSISGSGLEGAVLSGEIAKIYPTAKRVLSATGQEAMVEVEIRLLEQSALLKPGYSVSVRIHDRDAASAITVPYEAIAQDEYNMEYVYLLSPDATLRRQEIQTGKELLGSVEVTAGLTVEDVVILSPGNIGEQTQTVYIKGEGQID